VHISRIERVQRKFAGYALQELEWADMYNLPSYVDRCALICLETLTRIRSDACLMFVFDVLSGKAGSLNLLSLVNVIAPHYRTWGGDFLRSLVPCAKLSNFLNNMSSNCFFQVFLGDKSSR
jgi:hypothetical protein